MGIEEEFAILMGWKTEPKPIKRGCIKKWAGMPCKNVKLQCGNYGIYVGETPVAVQKSLTNAIRVAAKLAEINHLINAGYTE